MSAVAPVAIAVAVLAAAAGCSSGGNGDAATGCGTATDGHIHGRLESRSLRQTVEWDARATAGQGSGHTHPVLVLLHGSGADETQWTDIGLDDALRRSSADQPEAARPVVLTPDLPASTATPDAAAFLTDELLPLASRCFGATDDPAHRTIGGISAGGRTALEVAADRPDLFSIAGGHSAALRPDDAAALAMRLARARTRVQLDDGRQDGFLAGTRALAAALARHHVAVTAHFPRGHHDRAYWRSQLPQYVDRYLALLE